MTASILLSRNNYVFVFVFRGSFVCVCFFYIPVYGFMAKELAYELFAGVRTRLSSLVRNTDGSAPVTNAECHM